MAPDAVLSDRGNTSLSMHAHTHAHMHTHTQSAFLTSFISLLGTDLMIFPVKHKYFISVMNGLLTIHHYNLLTETQGQAAQTSLHCAWCCISPPQHNPSHWHTLTVPRFTSGSILSRNWDSVLWGDRKSANNWLLLSSGCCRSFWRGNENIHSLFSISWTSYQ